MDPREVRIRIEQGKPRAIPDPVRIQPDQGVVWTGEDVSYFRVEFAPNESPFEKESYDSDAPYSKYPVKIPKHQEKHWPYRIIANGMLSDPVVIVQPPAGAGFR